MSSSLVTPALTILSPVKIGPLPPIHLIRSLCFAHRSLQVQPLAFADKTEKDSFPRELLPASVKNSGLTWYKTAVYINLSTMEQHFVSTCTHWLFYWKRQM